MLPSGKFRPKRHVALAQGLVNTDIMCASSDKL